MNIEGYLREVRNAINDFENDMEEAAGRFHKRLSIAASEHVGNVEITPPTHGESVEKSRY